MRCDIDQFCCSSSIAALKTINTKTFVKTQALLFIFHAFCSSGIPLKFSHGENCDDKI